MSFLQSPSFFRKLDEAIHPNPCSNTLKPLLAVRTSLAHHCITMSTHYHFRSYSTADWAKYVVLALTATLAQGLCLHFVFNCRLIKVEDDWYGLFQYSSSGKDGQCTSYQNGDVLDFMNDPQLRLSQAGGVFAVVVGLPLWTIVLLTPFWKYPSLVWPKLVSIAVCLLAGNVQLLSVVKFVRLILRSFPTEKIVYDKKVVVVLSVCIWLVEAFALSSLGTRPIPVRSSDTEERGRPSFQSADLVKAASDTTRDTNGVDIICQSSSEETMERVQDTESGLVDIYNSTCAGEEGIGVESAFEICLSMDGTMDDATVASF